jgi:hypothetical protein
MLTKNQSLASVRSRRTANQFRTSRSNFAEFGEIKPAISRDIPPLQNNSRTHKVAIMVRQFSKRRRLPAGRSVDAATVDHPPTNEQRRHGFGYSPRQWQKERSEAKEGKQQPEGFFLIGQGNLRLH